MRVREVSCAAIVGRAEQHSLEVSPSWLARSITLAGEGSSAANAQAYQTGEGGPPSRISRMRAAVGW